MSYNFILSTSVFQRYSNFLRFPFLLKIHCGLYYDLRKHNYTKIARTDVRTLPHHKCEVPHKGYAVSPTEHVLL